MLVVIAGSYKEKRQCMFYIHSRVLHCLFPSQTIAMLRYTQLYVKLLHIYRSHITGTVKHAWLSLSVTHSLTLPLSLFLPLSLSLSLSLSTIKLSWKAYY